MFYFQLWEISNFIHIFQMETTNQIFDMYKISCNFCGALHKRCSPLCFLGCQQVHSFGHWKWRLCLLVTGPNWYEYRLQWCGSWLNSHTLATSMAQMRANNYTIHQWNGHYKLYSFCLYISEVLFLVVTCSAFSLFLQKEGEQVDDYSEWNMSSEHEHVPWKLMVGRCI